MYQIFYQIFSRIDRVL